MGLANAPRRRDDHIRSISWLFLGEGSGGPPPPRPALTAVCRLSGSPGAPGSPWLLALAANLSLAAWRRGEAVCLELPAARLPAAARLLGAPPAGLGLDWRGASAPAPWLEPLPGLILRGGGGSPPVGLPPCCWRFTLEEPTAAGESPILALLETEAALAPAAAGAPLFLLGLERTPAPRPGVTGIWGPLTRHQLLDPQREGQLTLRSGEGAVRRRYTGFLEALRATPTARLRERPA